MTTDIQVIGLCGVAQSGKDTFCEAAKNLFKEQGIKAHRVSFADALKGDVDEFLLDKIGISAFTTDIKEKTLIRDFLVSYGTNLMRKRDDMHWINKVRPIVKENISNNEVTIITDIRYINEIDWVQKELKGKCVHIARIHPSGKGHIPPANAEEKKNDPLLKSKADSSLNWLTLDDLEAVEWIVGDELNNLLGFTIPA